MAVGMIMNRSTTQCVLMQFSYNKVSLIRFDGDDAVTFSKLFCFR